MLLYVVFGVEVGTAFAVETALALVTVAVVAVLVNPSTVVVAVNACRLTVDQASEPPANRLRLVDAAAGEGVVYV